MTVSVHLSRVNATSPLSLDRLEAGDDGMDEILEEEEEEEDEESGAKVITVSGGVFLVGRLGCKLDIYLKLINNPDCCRARSYSPEMLIILYI